MKTHIIYIPGLGDRYDGFRSNVLKFWKIWDVSVEHVPIIWFDGGTMQSKIQRIKAAIDRAPKNSQVVLIGESAGATLALQLGSDERVSKVITLCGVARRQTPVSGALRRKAPALSDGVQNIPTPGDAEIHSVRAALDGVVQKKHSVAEGAKEHVIWSVGHITTIALCLTIFAPIITSIAKKQ